jgi:hypothetical protein
MAPGAPGKESPDHGRYYHSGSERGVFREKKDFMRLKKPCPGFTGTG